jgi:hypothetical protein
MYSYSIKITNEGVVISIQYEGNVLGTFFNFPLRVSLASALEPTMSPKHDERLRVVGCGLKNKLVRLLSLGTGSTLSPYRNRHLMRCMTRRLTAGQVAAVRDIAAKEAEELSASGKYVAALVLIERAIYLGHLPSRALKVWLHSDCREGLIEDNDGLRELVEEGYHLGCHHCQGVLALYTNRKQSLELARESSGKGSRYGQYWLGVLYDDCNEVYHDATQALVLFQQSAEQKLDAAQFMLGSKTKNWAEALRWYQLAADQGYPAALYSVARCYHKGLGVPVDLAKAKSFYTRAAEINYWDADFNLMKLSMLGV